MTTVGRETRARERDQALSEEAEMMTGRRAGEGIAGENLSLHILG